MNAQGYTCVYALTIHEVTGINMSCAIDVKEELYHSGCLK